LKDEPALTAMLELIGSISRQTYKEIAMFIVAFFDNLASQYQVRFQWFVVFKLSD
jgi:hypothetical protein